MYSTNWSRSRNGSSHDSRWATMSLPPATSINMAMADSAAQGPAAIALSDTRPGSAESLAARLRRHYPELRVEIRQNDPAGYELVVNATPLGMEPGDPLPIDPTRLDRQR